MAIGHAVNHISDAFATKREWVVMCLQSSSVNSLALFTSLKCCYSNSNLGVDSFLLFGHVFTAIMNSIGYITTSKQDLDIVIALKCSYEFIVVES